MKKIWFLVLIVYAILALFPHSLVLVLKEMLNILEKIIPALVLIYALMVIFNYFITPEFIKKHLISRGWIKWFFVVISGILSTGPIYVWYPFLAQLRKKGFNYGLIACFLYNRAIKIPLLPLAVFYFGLKYVVILTLVMIAMSIIQGLIVDALV